jgi:uncharacterized protein YkwD
MSPNRLLITSVFSPAALGVAVMLFALGCAGEAITDLDTPPVNNRPPTGALTIEAIGVMAPVRVEMTLTCSDPDGDPVTHELSYTGSSDFDVTAATTISLTRDLVQSVEIRGRCTDSWGASTPIMRHSLLVVNGAAQRDSIVTLTNSARISSGASQVTLDERLTSIAEAHARDMAERGYFSHTTPEGVTFGDRLRAAGIPFGYAGENIAQNRSASGAMEAWLNSTGHRENMLNTRFRRLGVGVYRASENTFTYYVQVFTD